MANYYKCDCGQKVWLIDGECLICDSCGNKFILKERNLKFGLPENILPSASDFEINRRFVSKLSRQEIDNIKKDC